MTPTAELIVSIVVSSLLGAALAAWLMHLYYLDQKKHALGHLIESWNVFVDHRRQIRSRVHPLDTAMAHMFHAMNLLGSPAPTEGSPMREEPPKKKCSACLGVSMPSGVECQSCGGSGLE